MDAKVSRAEITKRVAACVVDAIIFLSFYLFTLFISSDKSFTEFFNYIFSDTAIISTSIQGEVLETLLFIALETLMITKFGWTPGKLLFGIYIKDVNTLKNVALMQAVIRSTLKVLLLNCISNWFFILPILVLIFATFDQHKQTFYDKIAKTVVIDYRSEKCHLNSNYVGIARRVIAHIIDCSVVMGASLVYCLLVIITLDPTESKYFIMYICLFFLLSIIFRIIMVKRVGGTPGQLLCCICIKDANTLKNITFMQAMIRYALSEVVNPVLYFVLIICFWDFFDKYVPEWLFKSLLFLVFAPTILVSIHAMFDRQKKFLHDKITRTVAIRL